MSDVLSDLKFWAQIFGDSKRTLFCHPDIAEQLRAAVAVHDLGGVVTVMETRALEEGMAVLADLQALDAGLQESLQHRRSELF